MNKQHDEERGMKLGFIFTFLESFSMIFTVPTFAAEVFSLTH